MDEPHQPVPAAWLTIATAVPGGDAAGRTPPGAPARAAVPGGDAGTAPPVPVDGAAGRTRAGLFTALAGALPLPAHFGHNWDALSDSLRDLLTAGPLALLVDRAGELLADEPPGQFATLLTVLDDAAAEAPGRLRVVLRTDPAGADPLRRRVRYALGARDAPDPADPADRATGA